MLQQIKQYVGTDETSGLLQLDILKREGCAPESRVLEIGCGALHLAIPLIEYLNPGNYVGIDPNEWLRQSSIKQNEKLIDDKVAFFLSRDDFDASMAETRFDFVFAHSVLSHCARWQLNQFLQNTSKVLARDGKIVASIRLAEGNAYGSAGNPSGDSINKEWQYPGVTWFKMSTVREIAGEYELVVAPKPEYTKFYTETRPREAHDWLVFTRNTTLTHS